MINKIFKIYFFLFMLIMLNREFTPLGIDLRYICLLIGIFLIIFSILSQKKLIFDKKTKILTILYILIFFSNFMWIFNGLHINNDAFYVIIVSYLFNFISYLVFLSNRERICFSDYKKYLYFSLFILMLSMIYSIFNDLSQTPFSTYSGSVLDISKNFFGGDYRISGFAQDPNYSSLFLVLGMLTSLYDFKQSKKVILLVFIFIQCIFYCLSASKTILIALLISLLYLFISRKNKKFFERFILIIVFFIPLLVFIFDFKFFTNDISMIQRMQFWNKAIELFFKNPFFGNGLTSFRSFFETSVRLGWYVQCHSTLFEVLAENGIICYILFMKVFNFNLKIRNNYFIILTIIYMIFMINTETMYHIFSIFFIGILPLIIEWGNINGKEKSSDIYC